MSDRKDKIEKKFDRIFLEPQIDEEKLSGDFHKRFQERLELEKDHPTPLPSPAGIPMVPVMAGGMGIVLILALFSFFIFQTPDEPFVNLIQGNVSRAQKGSDLVTLSKGTQLKTGDQIVTGLSDWAIL